MTAKTDGVDDADLVEGATVRRSTIDPARGTGRHEYVGDLIDVEGETGLYEE